MAWSILAVGTRTQQQNGTTTALDQYCVLQRYDMTIIACVLMMFRTRHSHTILVSIQTCGMESMQGKITGAISIEEFKGLFDSLHLLHG